MNSVSVEDKLVMIGAKAPVPLAKIIPANKYRYKTIIFYHRLQRHTLDCITLHNVYCCKAVIYAFKSINKIIMLLK